MLVREMMTTSATTYEIFVQAMDVTNAAMEANRHSFVLKPMLSACSSELKNQDFAVEIYDDEPEHPVDFFTIRLVGNTFVLVSHSKTPAASAAWKVSVEYLRDVVENPRRYIDHPTLLAFDWLKQRLESVA
jgi:hypothetical protein